jgi:hypothetical protein
VTTGEIPQINESIGGSKKLIVTMPLSFVVPVKPSQAEIKNYIIKPMRRNRKGKTEEVEGFKHRDFIRYTKKNGEYYEGYITALYPEKKTM